VSSKAGVVAEELEHFGRLAVQLGFISEEQLTEALLVQRAALRSGFRKKLGTILIGLGHLSSAQRHAILSQHSQTPLGLQIGGFEITGKLGSGAMGNVYKARQVSLDRIVAFKVLRGELARNPSIRDRFLSEARAVARLNHPNIVSGISVGCERGYYFFAMEFVDGESMAEKLQTRRNGLPEEETLVHIRQIALALQHAHNRRLLHRDIKPDNILVTHDGQAKLTDLGLAHAMDQSRDARITQPGVTVGTPHYLSPEQAQGTDRLTRATDLYALGATLFHLLTGRVPYEDESCSAVMRKHISDPVPDARRVKSAISAEASSICMQLMQKSPQDRYPSAVKLAEDLDRVLQGEPPRHVTLIPHPRHRSVPATEKPAPRVGQGNRKESPRTPEGGRRPGARGFVSSIVKRLGL